MVKPAASERPRLPRPSTARRTATPPRTWPRRGHGNRRPLPTRISPSRA